MDLNKPYKNNSEIGKALAWMGDLARDLELGPVADRVTDLLAHLDKDAFMLALLGPRGAGKSMLLNAILGRGILPCAAGACTRVPIHIKVRTQSSLAVCYKQQPGGAGGEPVEELTPYVTGLTPEFAARAALVDHAEVGDPSPGRPAGSTLVDTPGWDPSQPIPAEIRATVARADVIILVLAADQELSEQMDRLSGDLVLAAPGRVLLVLTGADRISHKQETAESFSRWFEERARAQLAGRFGDGEVGRVFSSRIKALKTFVLSGSRALAARLRGDEAALAESGFPPFQTALRHLMGQGRDSLVREALVLSCMLTGRDLIARLEQLRQAENETGRAAGKPDPLLDGLRLMSQTEREKICRLAAEAESSMVPLLDGLAAQLKRAANRVIGDAPTALVEPGRHSGDQLAELRRRIGVDLSAGSRQLAKVMQCEVQGRLAAAIEEIHDFAVSLDRVVQHLGGSKNKAGEGMLDRLRKLRRGFISAVEAADSDELADPVSLFEKGLLAGILRADGLAHSLCGLDACLLGDPGQPAPEQRLDHFKQRCRVRVAAHIDQRLADSGPMLDELRAHVANRFEALLGEMELGLQRVREQVAARAGRAETEARPSPDQCLTIVRGYCARAAADPGPPPITTGAAFMNTSGETSMSSSASPMPSGFSYGSYRQVELGVLGDLAHLDRLAARLSLNQLQRQIAEARTRMENGRFSVAVVGEFKRGKSTFINALLGKEILPSDVMPTSATLNRVSYGLKPSVTITFHGEEGGEEHSEQVNIDRLAEYVTKLTPEAEAMAARVKEACVYYPVHFCKNNVDLIDTPGLSDDVTMTRVTMGVLPRVDAAILVISASAPFSETEGDFLDQLLVEHGLGSVLFVVTGIDRLRKAGDRDRVVDGVAERIRSRIHARGEELFGRDSEGYRYFLERTGSPKVFGISGYNALQAKIEHDEPLLEKSRFPPLEAALEKFLTEESGRVAMQTQLERIQGFCKNLLERVRADSSRTGSFEQDLAAFSALLNLVTEEGAEEKREIGKAQGMARERARSWYAGLAGDLIPDLSNAIDDAVIKKDHFDPKYVFSTLAWFRDTLQKIAGRVLRKNAQVLRTRIRDDLGNEISRLRTFAVTADHIIREAQVHLSGYRRQDPGSQTAELISARLGLGQGFEPGKPDMEAWAALRDQEKSSTPELIDAGPVLPDDLGPALKVSQEAMFPKGIPTWAPAMLRIAAFKKNYQKAVAEGIEHLLGARQAELERATHERTAVTFTVLTKEVERVCRLAADLVGDWKSHGEREQVLRESRETERRRMERELVEIRDRSIEISRHLPGIDKE